MVIFILEVLDKLNTYFVKFSIQLMIKEGVLRKKHSLFFVLWMGACIFSFSLFGGSVVWAQPLTHTVVKGDTLQSICDLYYGDGKLWPKLWKKNPSVSDPNLLDSGEVILLFEDIPIKTVSTPGIESMKSLIGGDDETWASTGVNVSEYCNVDVLGFLSPERVRPWGYVTSDETERIFLATNDTVFVTFEKGRKVKPGDAFNLYSESEDLEHPFTGENVGTVVAIKGRLVLKEAVSENLFKAEIVDSHKIMKVGDPILPYTPLSPCVQPSNPDWEKCEDQKECSTSIAACKDHYELLGEYSVVYLNQGCKHGIKRGNFFAIVTRMETPVANEETLPDQLLGYLMILESRPETATAVIVYAKRDFVNGMRLKAVNLAKVLEKTLAAQGYKGIKEIDVQKELVPILAKIRQGIDFKHDLPESLYQLSTMVKCSVK